MVAKMYILYMTNNFLFIDTHESGDRSAVLSSATTHLTLTTLSPTHSTWSETVPSLIISSSSSSTVAMTTSTPPSSSTTQPSNPDEDKLPTSSSSNDPRPSIFFYGTIIVICVIVVVFGIAALIISGMCWRRHKNLQERHSTVK